MAEERFQDIRKLATTFVFDVEEAVHDLPGSTPVRRMLANTGLEYLNRLAHSSAGDWKLRHELAKAYLRLGRVQGGSDTANLGDPTAALAGLGTARHLLDQIADHSPADRAVNADRIVVCYETAEVQRQKGADRGCSSLDRKD